MPKETDYSYMRSGKKVLVDDVCYPENITLGDILRGLSAIKRYNGQSTVSVLRHSIGVASFFRDIPGAFRYAMLHDASEAYMMDVPVGLKKFMTNEWHITNELLSKLILEKFNAVPLYGDKNAVDSIDKAVVAYEMDRSLGRSEYPRTLQVDPRVKNYAEMDRRYLLNVPDDSLPFLAAWLLGVDI